jgi:hypothetical protein
VVAEIFKNIKERWLEVYVLKAYLEKMDEIIYRVNKFYGTE